MTDTLDQEILGLLEETSFSHHSEDMVLYHNTAESAKQHARACFIADYETAKEAHHAATLLNFYMHAVQKGTPTYSTPDALTRAFRNKRMTKPSINVRRIQNKVVLRIDTSMPAGTMSPPLDVIDDLLLNPLAQKDDTLFEQVRKEVVDKMDDAIRMHKQRAHNLFFEKYFPISIPLGEEALKDIVKGATFSHLEDVFHRHLTQSAGVVLFSGDSTADEVMNAFSPFMARARQNELSSEPCHQELPQPTGPVFIKGPSEQTYFLRAYSLSGRPMETGKPAVKIANYILGGGWTGHLMQIVREKHHLVYGIYSSYMPKMNTILISTNHNPEVYGRIADLTGEIVKGVASGAFREQEFNAAKDYLLEKNIAEYGCGLRTCDQPEFRLGHAYNQYVLRTDTKPLSESYRALASVEIEDVQDVAKRFFDPDTSQIFTYGKEGIR